MDSDENQLQVEGFTARLQGQPPTANPYPWATEQFRADQWNAGYAAAGTRIALHNRTVTTY